ncbi:hypothetical protein [Mycobacterium paraffinicum]|uniref:Uncharacterized protein n=1 Tax=Mycobacterium paraffinicum TaxID=53378 RepID=A0ABP8F272_9MYCO|nr:hypothetical protein [Mycobacterium paraffinicum]MCV7311905.1 hypothetical protein [Mycobacterium paraffinicum]
MVNQHGEPGVGDRVMVSWGLEEAYGEIVEVYSTGLGPRAQVRLLDDPEGPTVVLPLDSLTPASLREDIDEIETAAASQAYERSVDSALDRIIPTLSRLHPEIRVRRFYDLNFDSAADFELRFDKRRVLIDAKHYRRPEILVSTDMVLTVAGLTDASTGALLVSNSRLAPTAFQRLEQLWDSRMRVWFAQWRTQRDDKQLRAALIKFIENWR